MAKILVATLGESPILITGMVDKLAQDHNETIEKVIVLYPTGKLIPFGYDMIEEALGKDTVEAWKLPFDDADTEENTHEFLYQLISLFREKTTNEDTVYLSLAGGRKNMSALTALVTPFFPQIKKLYHLLDQNEDTSNPNFKSLEELIDISDTATRKKVLHPKPEQLDLVDIPIKEQQQRSDEFFRNFSIEELRQMWDTDPRRAEIAAFYGWSLQADSPLKHILPVFVTDSVKQEYECMRTKDATNAKMFAECFEHMQFPMILLGKTAFHSTIKGTINGRDIYYHHYKRGRTVQRPFYHTEPDDIASYQQGKKIERVIISDLVIEREGEYDPSNEVVLERSLEEQKKIDIGKGLHRIETLFPNDSVLLVPLGASPMVATQLYALLKERLERKIHEVILLYPGQHAQIHASARLIQRAFKTENKSLKCTPKPIPGIRDTRTTKDCRLYQDALEEQICQIKTVQPYWTIDLALSGGRKGMSAIAMFAAQKAGLPYLYHTLITDEDLDRKVQRETELKVLSGSANSKDCYNRLFLRAYNNAIDNFVLLRIPVVPASE